VAVGVVVSFVVVLLVAGLVVGLFFYLRRRKQRKAMNGQNQNTQVEIQTTPELTTTAMNYETQEKRHQDLIAKSSFVSRPVPPKPLGLFYFILFILFHFLSYLLYLL
jgi:hypothetical protein